MNIEFEAKWIEFPEDLRERLKKEGFVQTKSTTLYRRSIFHFPDSDKSKNLDKWGRVRDEGDCVRISIKKEKETVGIDGVKEIDIEIDSYEKGVSLFKAVGLEEAAYQESTREVWEKENTEVVFDQWPGMPLYIEIEGESEEAVKKTAKSLDIDFNKAYFGAVSIFEDALGLTGKDLSALKEITFEKPLISKK